MKLYDIYTSVVDRKTGVRTFALSSIVIFAKDDAEAKTKALEIVKDFEDDFYTCEIDEIRNAEGNKI